MPGGQVGTLQPTDMGWTWPWQPPSLLGTGGGSDTSQRQKGSTDDPAATDGPDNLVGDGANWSGPHILTEPVNTTPTGSGGGQPQVDLEGDPAGLPSFGAAWSAALEELTAGNFGAAWTILSASMQENPGPWIGVGALVAAVLWIAKRGA